MYAREFDGNEHHFGVVGVEEGTLIMYDRETQSQWSQLFGEAVRGSMRGKKLVKLPSTMTTWAKWRELHPDTTVYIKPSVPYSRRFSKEAFEGIAKMEPGPVRRNDVVVGLEGHVEARAYLVRRLAKSRLVQERFEGAPIAVYLGSDMTTASAFDRTVDGRALSFRLTDDDELVDEQTNSRWNPVSGEAHSGPLEGKKLKRLVSTYSVWYAWEHYRPDTTIHGEP